MKWLYRKELKDRGSLAKVEAYFGIKFPSDFREVVLEHNAATPTPNTIDTSRQTGKAFGELIDFNLDARENIISLYNQLENKIPAKIYPITMDPGGNFLCYDFRIDIANPQIVRWDHEQKFTIEHQELVITDHEHEPDYYHLDFVADSFTALLKILYGDENDGSTSWAKFYEDDKLKQFTGEDLIQINRIRALQGLPPIKH